MVGLMADRAIGEEGVQVNFFGEPARFPAGPAALALRPGAALIPGFALRSPDGSIDAFACAPISIVPSGDRERDIAALTGRWVRVLEEQVRRAPEQWHVLQPVWVAPRARTGDAAPPALVGGRMEDASLVD
jgi:KDO2-lipid IV(A) lauroyltransferase